MTISLRHLFYLTAVVCLLSSCAASSNKYYPVRNANPRVSTCGFYIFPPPGGDWYEKHYDESLYYFKNTRGERYALTTQATEISFPGNSSPEQEMIDYIEHNKRQQIHGEMIKSSQFEYISQEVNNTPCVRYELSYDDYGSPQKGDFPFIRIFNRGMVCRHPNSPEVGIDISYMEKYLANVPTKPSLQKEGEVFLSNLNFFDLKRR